MRKNPYGVCGRVDDAIGAAVREHTAAVRACTAARDYWMDSISMIPGLSRAEFAATKAVARAHDAQETIADIEHDFPELMVDDDTPPIGGPAPGDAVANDAVVVDARASNGLGATVRDADDPAAAAVESFDGLVVRLGLDGDDLEAACEASAPRPDGAVGEGGASDGGAARAEPDGDQGKHPIGTPGAGPSAPTPADHEPPGGTAFFMTAHGDEAKVHITHYMGRAIMRSRKAHVEFLASHCETGASVVPFPRGTRAAGVHADFERELGAFAHDSGANLLRQLRGVCDGDLPEAPARYTYLSADVKVHMKQTNMCIVLDCPNTVHEVNQCAALHHTCEEHSRADIRSSVTGVVYRSCGVCKTRRDLERCFPKTACMGQHTLTCGKCSEHNGCVNAAECKAACVDQPDDGELEAGLDRSGEYRANRVNAAMSSALDNCVLGGSILTPYLVHAAYSAHAMERRGVPRCLRKGCDNKLEGTARKVCGTLCRSCSKVRLSSNATWLHRS